ncbi:MAG: long-chain fatty acid--CoA ligase [Parabacteroides sp.]|nr:long-chain fatty acid--CoA ligase [Parabacteroides sp.]
MIYYHFAELIHRQAEKYGSRTALKFRDNITGKWLKISWKEFSEKVMLTAKAIAEFEIDVQENIGVYSQNMPQCLFTDFAAYANRVVSIPMYATSSPEQVKYIVNDAKIKTLFVGEQLQYNNAFKVLKESDILKRLIIFDSQVKLNPEDDSSIYFEDFLRLGDNTHAESMVKIRMNEAVPEDLATIIYTSGTTGESKGVMLHHYNYLEAMRIHDIRLSMTDKDLSMCFLPLTHIFEKAWTCYCIHKGMTVAINQDPKMIQKTLAEVHPTAMCSVPRFWEKVYTGVQDKINSSSSAMKKVFSDAIEVGRKYNLEYKNKGIPAPLSLKLKFQMYDKTVFTLLKRVLGLERGRLFPVAGAPLSDKINEFLQSVNIPIVYGYGLSETTATVSCSPGVGFVFGSIGKIMPDVQVRIDPDNNEILVKGKTIMSGYYNKPEENAKAFTEDGFFRTGDAGRIEGETLFFLERIKDLYKTSNGKYIAPQAIEMAMNGDKYIEQIAVIGDERKYVTALVVPAYPLLEKYAEEKGIKIGSREDLVNNKDIIRFIETRIEENQKNLAPFEKIKRFALLTDPFMLGCELTDTLKLRRSVILQKYAEIIDKMYEE